MLKYKRGLFPFMSLRDLSLILILASFTGALALMATSRPKVTGLRAPMGRASLKTTRCSGRTITGSGSGSALVSVCPTRRDRKGPIPTLTTCLLIRRRIVHLSQPGNGPNNATVLVLEVRQSVNKGSINQNGHYQSALEAVEVHVKDEQRFPGQWAFFGFRRPG